MHTHSNYKKLKIADVAVWKCHQRQAKIVIFLPALYWNQQSCFSAIMHTFHTILHDRGFLKTTFE